MAPCLTLKTGRGSAARRRLRRGFGRAAPLGVVGGAAGRSTHTLGLAASAKSLNLGTFRLSTMGGAYEDAAAPHVDDRGVGGRLLGIAVVVTRGGVGKGGATASIADAGVWEA